MMIYFTRLKRFCVFVLFFVFTGSFAQSGFNNVTQISPLNISFSTADVSQSKTWTYAGKQWAVLVNAAGTCLYRLDGSSWTNTLTLASGTTAKADVKILGNVIHVLTWKGISSYLYSLQYDVATGKYKAWTVRSARVSVTLDAGVTTATIDVDASGRMWMASNGNKSVYVRWSDAPYATWSNGIVLASGLTTSDIGAVIAMPGVSKTGVFWSNKTTKRFGFRTHNDGADPAVWSADEVPAAQSALNVNGGFADNQFNLKSLANGTLFSVVKNAYSQATLPQIELLIRRPDGSWDVSYPVTINEGINPVIAVNERLSKINVFYTLPGQGIAYKQSSSSSIAFSAPQIVLSGAYDNASTSKANYDSAVIVIASNATSAVGFTGFDNAVAAADTTSPFVASITRQLPIVQTTNATSVVFRVRFSEPVYNVDATDFLLVTGGSAQATIQGNTVAEVAGSNRTTFDVTLSAVAGNGTLRLDLKTAATGISDNSGNLIKTGYSAGQMYTIQQLPPELTVVTLYSGNANPLLAKPGDLVYLRFTSSEPINMPVVSIASKPVNVVTAGTANSYLATYITTDSDASGNIPFSINFSTAAGTNGTPVSATTNGSVVTFDKTLPEILGIARYMPVDSATNATAVTYEVSFSEKVMQVDASDFEIAVLSGNVSGTIAASGVTTSGADSNVYRVTVGSISGTGTFRLNLKPAGTGIIDAASNQIKDGAFIGRIYNIINTTSGVKPTLTTVNFTSGNVDPYFAKPGDILSLSFTASAPLKSVLVSIATHVITPVAGAGNTFTALYTITANDVAGVVPFTINFTNAQDVPGDQVSTSTNGSSVWFDKTTPSVVSIKRQTPLTQTTSASSLTYRLLFSEPVTGVDASDFAINVFSGAVSGSISNITQVGIDETTYDVVINSVSGNGIIKLDLNNANTGIKDRAGNMITSGFTTGETYTVLPVLIPGGFTSQIPLQPVELTQPTKDKPQAKAWYYANKWWCVLSVAAGTKLFRLDGTAWTDILLLNNKTSKPDCRVDGDLVHVLCYKGAQNNSLLYTLKYDAITNTYKLWSNRPTGTLLMFPSGSETATLAIDGTGRLWTASDGVTDVSVWYCDAPYTSWIGPITIADNIKSDDICAITYIPALSRIGIFWSNQVTKQFGFRTHADGTDPMLWTNDEMPASQSALNSGNGFADDHMNIKIGSDGTLYCGAKTSYNKNGFAKIILLVRRPNGVWDDQYIATMNPEGTQPIVLLNERKQKIRLVYASLENGGDLLYRESNMTNISFGPAHTLLSNPGVLYDYATGSHQNFDCETLLLATNVTSVPQQAVGFILRDEPCPLLESFDMKKNIVESKGELSVYPNPFGSMSNVKFSVSVTGQYSLTLVDANGGRQRVISSGWAAAGTTNTVRISGDKLAAGLYYVNLKTLNENKTVKVLVLK